MPYLIPIDRQGREHHDGLGWVAVDCEQLFFTFHNLALEVRVSDKAGNWSAYQTLAVYRAGSTTVNTPTVTTPTVITTTVVTTTVVAPKVTLSKSVTAKSIATYAKLAVPANSKVSMKVVASYAKSCKVSGTTLKGLKAGTCKVTVTVTPKKGRATSKTVTLKVTK